MNTSIDMFGSTDLDDDYNEMETEIRNEIEREMRDEMNVEEKLRYCVELWQSAGARPYEVLKENGVYDFFISRVTNSTYYYVHDDEQHQYLYRGMFGKNLKYEVGDTIQCDNITSWSEDYNAARQFTGENGVVLILPITYYPKLNGIVIGDGNPFYVENEVALAPLSMNVIEVDGINVHVTKCRY